MVVGEKILKQGVPPLAIVDTIISINHDLIREAMRRLDAITSEAEKIRRLLAKVETTEARAKPPQKRTAKGR